MPSKELAISHQLGDQFHHFGEMRSMNRGAQRERDTLRTRAKNDAEMMVRRLKRTGSLVRQAGVRACER